MIQRRDPLWPLTTAAMLVFAVLLGALLLYSCIPTPPRPPAATPVVVLAPTTAAPSPVPAIPTLTPLPTPQERILTTPTRTPAPPTETPTPRPTETPRPPATMHQRG